MLFTDFNAKAKELVEYAQTCAKTVLKFNPEIVTMAADEDSQDGYVLEEVLSLPAKYKEVIYLKYFEGYDGGEIAQITGRKVNSVYKLLDRGRDMLAQRLGGDDLE